MNAGEVESATPIDDPDAECGRVVLEVGGANESNSSVVPSELASELDRVSRWGLRYGLVLVIGWIGAMKFTAYEAEGISGLVDNSPLMSWAYNFLTQRQFAAALGAGELVIAILIGCKSIWPRGAVIGAAAAVGMFLTTLGFMITTPGVGEASAGGFPAISVVPGQFLLKDVVLLAASMSSLADAVGSLPKTKA